MSNRLTARFADLRAENRRGLIPFITAGDPDLSATRELVIELAAAGASAIELGVPFSDPMADGPVIQRASERALRHNFGVAEVLRLVRDVRHTTDVPIVLFSYYNPLLQFGVGRLAAECADAGADGVLVTDLSPEEAAGGFADALDARDLSLIFLIAPTSTDERLQSIAARAGGFIYAVSRAGVTGEQREVSAAAEQLVRRVRRYTDLPVAVGFGISSAAQVEEVWRFADAAVVGSALVAEIEKNTDRAELVARVGAFARTLLPTAPK